MQLVRRAESREQIVRSKRCYTPSPSATIAEGENLQISAFAYNTGDRVKRQAPYKSAVVGKSFDPKWIRPYRITKFVAEYVVVLELIEPVHHPEGTRRIRVKPVIIYIWKKNSSTVEPRRRIRRLASYWPPWQCTPKTNRIMKYSPSVKKSGEREVSSQTKEADRQTASSS